MTVGYSCTLGGLGDEVIQMCSEHVDEQKDTIKKQVKKAGKVAAEALQHASPKLTGEYASGWKSTTESEGLDSYKAIVHNTAKPSLAHLLEFGHGLVYFGHPTGRRVGPKPHMDAGFNAGAKELMG